MERSLTAVLEYGLLERPHFPAPAGRGYGYSPRTWPIPHALVDPHVSTVERNFAQDHPRPLGRPSNDWPDGGHRAAAKQPQVVNRVNRICVHPVPDDLLRLSCGQRRGLVLLILHPNVSQLVPGLEIRQHGLRARIMPTVQCDEYATLMAVRLTHDRFGIAKIVTDWFLDEQGPRKCEALVRDRVGREFRNTDDGQIGARALVEFVNGIAHMRYGKLSCE